MLNSGTDVWKINTMDFVWSLVLGFNSFVLLFILGLANDSLWIQRTLVCSLSLWISLVGIRTVVWGFLWSLWLWNFGTNVWKMNTMDFVLSLVLGNNSLVLLFILGLAYESYELNSCLACSLFVWISLVEIRTIIWRFLWTI